SIVNALRRDTLDKWLLVSLVALLFNSLVSGVFLNPASLFFSSLLFAIIIKRAKISFTIFSLENRKMASLARIQVVLIPAFSMMWLSSHLYAFQGLKHYDADRLQQALALNPGNERAWYDLSRVQYQKFRDTHGSLHSLERFVELYPYHIQALYLLAQRQITAKHYEAAKYSLERLLKMYPSYEKAKQLKRYLQRLIDTQHQ
ncbi:MAG: hypothetical protein AAGB12_12860, partial [Pseudomonadota bacterium]